MEASFVVCVLVICLMVEAATTGSVIPPSWRYMCSAKPDHEILGHYVGSADHVVRIECHVKGDTVNILNFQTLRDQLQKVEGVQIFLHVTCSNGGMISLPWPMKANGLVGLKVSECAMTGKYADFKNPEVSEIPDQLRVVDIRNSVWLIDDSAFQAISSPDGLASMTSDYDCGQDGTIEYMTTSNVSTLLFPKSEETISTPTKTKTDGDVESMKLQSSNSASDSNDRTDSHAKKSNFQTMPTPPGATDTSATSENNATDSAEQEYTNMLNNLLSLDIKCNFKELRVIDESISQVMSVDHFLLMISGATYPELRVMNYSWSGIRNLPPELQNFGQYFPKLEYLDLSGNYLTEVHLKPPPRENPGVTLTLDARHNRIANIALTDVLEWASTDGVFVDVRENPLHCGCEMAELLQKMQSDSFFVSNLQKYAYLQELTCFTPARFRGQRLLEVQLECPLRNYFRGRLARSSLSRQFSPVIIGLSVVAGVVVVVAFVVTTVLIVVRRSSPDKMRKLSLRKDSQLEKLNTLGTS